jgi:hypothetical protein
MTRRTSKEAYDRLIASGRLGGLHRDVVTAVYNREPCTSAEAFEEMRERGVYENPISQSRARFTELRDLGVLLELGEKICNVTGRYAIAWGLTGNPPVDKETIQPRKRKGPLFAVLGQSSLLADLDGHRLFFEEWKAKEYVKNNGGEIVKVRRI